MMREKNPRRDSSNPSPLAGEVGWGGTQHASNSWAIVTLAAIVSLFLICRPALADDDLISRDWSVTASRSLDTYAPTTPDVEKLINDAVDSSWTMPICSYKFIDVYDGNLRLVASLDINGRHFCNEVVVIEKNDVHINVINKWNTVAADNVNDMLSDLDGDHSPEFIVTQAWSKAETGRCQATWRKIYKWNRGKFTNESASFPKFYKIRLKELTSAIMQEADPSCDTMEMDKISRMLGAPKAGFERAVGWMKSPDASLRRKAAAVFADIGDESSKKNLASLAKDADPLTAESAQLYLVSPPRPD